MQEEIISRLGKEKYHSFLMRTWFEGAEDALQEWQFQVKSIQTGELWQFGNLKELYRFLQILTDTEQS
jgi:hypothetical protein